MRFKPGKAAAERLGRLELSDRNRAVRTSNAARRRRRTRLSRYPLFRLNRFFIPSLIYENIKKKNIINKDNPKINLKNNK